MAAKDIEAGRAHVSVYLKNKLGTGLQKLQSQLRSASRSVSSVGSGMARAGGLVAAGATAIIAPLVAAASSFAKVGDQVQKMSIRTGIGSAYLSEMGFAAEQSGTNLETFEKAVARMQRVITDAGDGNTTYADSLAGIGLSFADLEGLSPDQQFERIAAGVAGITDPTERAARAMEIFGKSGAQLLPLIESDMASLRNEARELGLSFTEDQAASAAALADAQNRMSRSIKGAWNRIGAAVAPIVASIADSIASTVAIVSTWIERNQALFRGLLIGASIIAAAATGFAVLGAAIMAVGAVLSALGTIVGIVSAVIAALNVPLLVVVGVVAAISVGLAGLIALFAYAASESGLLATAVQFVTGVIGDMLATLKSAVGGITDALASGNYALAVQILWASVKLLFFQGAAAALRAVVFLWNNFTSITGKFGDSLLDLLWNIFVQVPKLMANAILGGPNSAFNLGKNLGQQLATGFTGEIAAAQAELDRLNAEAAASRPDNSTDLGPDPATAAAMAALEDDISSLEDDQDAANAIADSASDNADAAEEARQRLTDAIEAAQTEGFDPTGVGVQLGQQTGNAVDANRRRLTNSSTFSAAAADRIKGIGDPASTESRMLAELKKSNDLLERIERTGGSYYS